LKLVAQLQGVKESLFYFMETTKEIWKDIPNYEGYYQVSNLGRVKSLKRVVCRSDGSFHTLKEKLLKASINGVGYLATILSKDGKKKSFKVHQLVAMAFLGHEPCGYKIVVDHVNNDKLNNQVDNLQLTTSRHNVSKDIRRGASKYIGVSWYKNSNKWMASIRINGKQKHLGYFNDELDASKAYQNALKGIGGYNG